MKYKLIECSEGYLRINSHKHPLYNTNLYHRIKVCEYYGWSSIPESVVIHHINGDKKDNRIENLAILTRSEHSKLHSTGKKHLPKTIEKMRKKRNPRSKLAKHLDFIVHLREIEKFSYLRIVRELKLFFDLDVQKSSVIRYYKRNGRGYNG